MQRLSKAKVRQACDCCHTRKIRCSGTYPCTNCSNAHLTCTYLAVHKKTGPKGPRRSVPRLASISTDRSTTSTLAIRGNSPSIGGASHGASISSKKFQGSPLVPIDFVTSCLDAFFEYKYPITPVLHRQQTQAALLEFGSEPEFYGLMVACCAVMVQSPQLLVPAASTPPPSLQSLTWEPQPTNIESANHTPFVMPDPHFLTGEVLRARRASNYIESPSLTTVQTSFFLFSAFFCLGEDTPAWFYLREAITFLQLLRLHEEDTYRIALSGHPLLSTYSRRMFWVLFVTERAYALQRHRVLTLQKTISLPIEDLELQAKILPGFSALISLFEPFNDEFLALWNQSAAAPATPTALLVKMQRILMYTMPSFSGCTENQLADLLVSREWLKVMIWQLCVANTLLSSSSTEESLSLRYPVTIAREVILVSQLIPVKAFEANGVGILEKLFDIGCSLADVLSLKSMSMQSSTLEVGPRDYLAELIRMVGTTLGGSDKHLQILLRKSTDCLQLEGGRPVSITEPGWTEPRQICEVDDEYHSVQDQDLSWESNDFTT